MEIIEIRLLGWCADIRSRLRWGAKTFRCRWSFTKWVHAETNPAPRETVGTDQRAASEEDFQEEDSQE